jgi:hypothetical protein
MSNSPSGQEEAPAVAQVTSRQQRFFYGAFRSSDGKVKTSNETILFVARN